MSWYKYTKDIYGIDTFGASAPMEDVLEHFNFTAEKVAEAFLKI
jgi:transketolase